MYESKSSYASKKFVIACSTTIFFLIIIQRADWGIVGMIDDNTDANAVAVMPFLKLD